MRRATSRPILPKPRIAKVLPYNSWPEYNFLSHLPAFSEAAAGTTFLANVVINEHVNSHALIAFPPGVLQ